MPSELELKLAATPEKLNKIKSMAFPGAASQSAWRSRHLANTYFDTEHYQLRELGIAIRLREIGDTVIQSVKSEGQTMGGLHQRNEDEQLLESAQLDIDRVQEPYLQILLEEAIEEDGELRPCFRTDFDRDECELTFSDGTQIEVALDQGQISRDEMVDPICEIELELKSGSAEYLFALGRYLIKDHELSLFNASKARRGFNLCRDLPKNHRRMQVIELSKGIEAETAFERICFAALKHFHYYEMVLDEEESAHMAVLEMYRALMYLQHMYMVFGALIPRQATRDLRRNWNWLAQAMRPIVDAAKHKRYLMRYLRENADWDLVEEQQQKIRQEATAAINELKSILKTQRYNLMMLNMTQWLYFKEWRNFIPEKDQHLLSTPIIDYAKAQLNHMLRELKRELGPKVELKATDYFRLVAKLRRALDTGLFFGGLFDAKKRQQYRQMWLDVINGIRELQMNHYIAELQRANHSDEEIAVWLEKRDQPVLEALEKTRQAIFKTTPYWA